MFLFMSIFDWVQAYCVYVTWDNQSEMYSVWWYEVKVQK